MVPEFEEFLLPTLKVLSDGSSQSVQQIREAVIAAFRFSDEELKEKTRSGNNTKVNDRITWALTYLRQAGLVDSPQRAYGKISFTGLALLKNPPKVITRNFLYSKYPSFRDFNNRKRVQKKNNKKTSDATLNNPTKRSDYSTTESSLVQTLFELRTAVETFRKLGFEPSEEQLGKIIEFEKQLAIEKLFPAVAQVVVEHATEEKFVINVKYDTGKVYLHFDNSEEGIASFPQKSTIIKISDIKETKDDKPTERNRRPNLNFYQMGLIDGDELTYIADDNIKVTIASENRVKYQGKEYSLTRLTKELKGLNHAIQPTGEWEFEGQNLLDLYNETYPSDK